MGPVARGVLEARARGHIVLCDLGILRVIGLRAAEERLQRDEGGFQGKNGRPGVLEDVEADGARGRRDIRMVDLGDKFHLYGLKRIRIGYDDVLRWGRPWLKDSVRRSRGSGEMISETHDLEVATLIRGVLWTLEGAAKVKWRVVDELDVDVRRLVIFTIFGGSN